jgi:hypothetical protein
MLRIHFFYEELFSLSICPYQNEKNPNYEHVYIEKQHGKGMITKVTDKIS